MAIQATYILHTLSTVCAVGFLFMLPARLWKLRKSRIRNAPGRQGLFKAALSILLAVLLLSYLVKISVSNIRYEVNFSVSLFVSALAAVSLSLLFLLEQQRSHKASDLATLYLLASILCDVVYLSVSSEDTTYPIASRIMILRCCMHSVFLVLECCIKRPTATALSRKHPPEELYGILSRVLFTWINPIILYGYKNILLNEDTPPLSQNMKPEFTRRAILKTWSQRAKPETKWTLPLALMKCLREPFFAAIMPRLFLIVFRYSQPTLIRETIRYVAVYPRSAENNHGFWLIVSAVGIYIGLSISTALYQHNINKLKLMTRSALIGLIHDKTMKSPSIAYDNGEATTLMSTDAESLDGIGGMVHETWAQVIEVMIGITLLATQVGWIWPLPLFLIYLCSHMSRFVAKHLQPRQKAWNNATQNRIAATSSILSAMKVVKMLGLQHSLAHRIRELRQEELSIASRLRWVMVYYNASANALGIFSPAITLVIYATISGARGDKLDTETAFTTMAILSMVTHPANMVMTIMPRFVAAFSGFERIQTFLLQSSLQASRGTLPRAVSNTLFWDPASGHLTKHRPAIQVHQLRIGHKQILLENVNIEVAAMSFAVISGPTGSGKSTLLRAILGEVVPAHGSISVSTQQIAYCSQKPWLPNGTIKEVICGTTNFDSAHNQDDESWYHTVIKACCLTHDFNSLPEGDQTQVGSRGLNLSGGQRQRVTLARALFARCDILLLDDTFSGLDGDTEQTVFDNLFGSAGLVRQLKTTVVLVSNSSQYFQAADRIVVLGSRTIRDQGPWRDINVKAASIAKFSSSHHLEDNMVLSANFAKLSTQFLAKDESRIDLARQTGDPTLFGYYLGFAGFMNLTLLTTSTVLYSFFITIPQYWLQLWTEARGGNTAFYVCGFLFLSTMSWTSTSAQMWVVLIQFAPYSGSRLHQRLLQIVTSAPLSYFSKTENGSILNRFSQDIQLIDKRLPSALQTLLTQIFKLLMQIILLCIAEKWLAVSLPACMIVVYIIQKAYLRTSRQLRLLELESQAGVFSSFLESVEGLETIRSFGWSRAVIQNNVFCVDKSQRPEFLLLCLQRWLNLVLDLLAAAVATSVVAIAVAFRGQVSGAQVGIALNIMLVANTTLLKLVENWTDLETSLGAIARLKILDETTVCEDGNTGTFDPAGNWPSNGCIEFTNLTASYQSKSFALRNLNLTITAGQKLVVCGRTGSGKSTLLLSLLRLLEPQSGKIQLDGIDIKQVKLDVLRQQAFITVPQDPLILSNETLRFNLDTDGSTSDKILVGALIKTGLWAHFSKRETGFSGGEMGYTDVDTSPGFGNHPILDQKISLFQELSAGQCQLFAVCRTLVKATSLRRYGVKPVILLDEITSSLDSDTEAKIYRIIDDEFTEEGHTVIIVAHRLSALKERMKRGRDIVALMVDGRFVEIVKDLDQGTLRRLGQVT